MTCRWRLAQEFGDEPLFQPLYRRGGRKRAVKSSGQCQTPGIHLLNALRKLGITRSSRCKVASSKLVRMTSTTPTSAAGESARANRVQGQFRSPEWRRTRSPGEGQNVRTCRDHMMVAIGLDAHARLEMPVHSLCPSQAQKAQQRSRREQSKQARAPSQSGRRRAQPRLVRQGSPPIVLEYQGQRAARVRLFAQRMRQLHSQPPATQGGDALAQGDQRQGHRARAATAMPGLALGMPVRPGRAG